MTVVWICIVLMMVFWGSRVESSGVRIMSFGLFTLYDSQRFWKTEDITKIAREVVAREITAKLTGFLATRDKEEQDPDEPDLWDHLEDAGFTTIDINRDLRLTDEDKIDWLRTDYDCVICEGPMIELWELYRPASPSPKMVGRIKKHPLGHVCGDCGIHVWPEEGGREPIGVIAPFLQEGANFFDVLAHIGEMRQPQEPEPAPASEGGGDAAAVATVSAEAAPTAASDGTQA